MVGNLFLHGDGVTFFFSIPAHKDPYENIYCVVHGYKDIILHPPSDVPWLYYKDYPPAQYVADHEPQEPESLKIQPIPDMAEVPWISVDPLEPNLEDYPDYANASPVRIRVEAGDALYLPSLWFHHLRQSHGCIAVNFWYDMEYDCKYNYFNLVSGLSKELRSGQRKS